MGQLSKVRKSNDLIQAGYKLSLIAQRVFILLLTKVDTTKQIDQDYTITAQEYSHTYGINLKIAYRDLGKGINELYNTDIRIHNRKLKIIQRNRIADKAVYYYGKGKVSISFANGITKHLCEFKKCFTTYTIGQVSGLKSSYSVRLYELLIQFRITGDRCISIEHFRECLGVGNKYIMYNNLKRRVIEIAVKELNIKTNLTISWHPIKNSYTVELLSFSFNEVK